MLLIEEVLVYSKETRRKASDTKCFKFNESSLMKLYNNDKKQRFL